VWIWLWRYARAACSWLELGNHFEANSELEKITPQLRSHPDVLEIRWQIYAKDKKWNACQDIANTITQLALPAPPAGFIWPSSAVQCIVDKVKI
jgi:hypothetical protein